MTISKSKPPQGQYDENYDLHFKTATIAVGVSLITVEEETFEQDGRVVTCPVDSDITYITVPREMAYLPCGGASYSQVADILDTEGYPKRLWKIVGVWTCISSEDEPF